MLKKMVLTIVLAVIFPVFFVSAAIETNSQFIFPQYSKKVSLDFKNTDLKDVLKAFSKQIGVNFVVNQDVPDHKVTIYLQEVPVEEALEKVLASNNLGYDFDQSMSLFVVKNKPLDDEDKVITRVFQLRYASVDSSALKTTGGQAAPTGSSSFASAFSGVLTPKGKTVDNPRTNSIVVTDVQRNFPDIERLIARLDVPVKQVAIQVEMLDVSKSSVDDLGAKYNLSAVFSGSKIDSFMPFDINNLMNKSKTTQQVASGSTGTTTTTTSSSSAKYSMTALKGTPGSLDFSGSTIALNFLKGRSDTRSLARPRIITNDNETASIEIATNEAIGITQESVTTGGSSTSGTRAERYTTGVLMTVTPQINPLTDEITMVVLPKVIDATESVTYGTSVFKNPEERSAKVTLRVPNGRMVVIGGLLRRSKSDTRTSVPFLGQIPILGAAFRSRDLTSSDRELMIFLTPVVLDSDLAMPDSAMKKDIQRQVQEREQSFSDTRSGLIDKEMDKANNSRKGY